MKVSSDMHLHARTLKNVLDSYIAVCPVSGSFWRGFKKERGLKIFHIMLYYYSTPSQDILDLSL